MHKAKNIYRIFLVIDFVDDDEGVDYQLSYTRTILFNDRFGQIGRTEIRKIRKLFDSAPNLASFAGKLYRTHILDELFGVANLRHEK